VKHFKAIAAMSLNRVIGAGNKIPWHLPEDFKWFKRQTAGNVVVMGRKTFESLGQPLPNRKNLILTRHPRQLIRQHPEVFGQYKEWRGGRSIKRQKYQLRFTRLDGNRNEDIRIFNSLKLLDPEEFSDEIFICGGAQIYEQLLPRCSDLFLTLVKREVEGDAFFPPFEKRFLLLEELRDTPEFKILHYVNRSLVESDKT
jgi:dihydrofolate reductase